MSPIVLVMCVMFNAISGDTIVKIPGDFMIGLLIRIRKASDPNDKSMKCEEIREIHGMQKLEAAILALEIINNHTTILPGVTLGLEVRDICYCETAALRESLTLVRNASLSGSCRENYQQCRRENFCLKNSTMIGVIGADTSERTKQVQNLLKLFHIPQIGYNHNTPELDDRNKYWTYFRVRSSDNSQAKVVRDILKKWNWSYVGVITTQEDESGWLFDCFRKLVEPDCVGSGICIAKKIDVESSFNGTIIDTKILEINQIESVRVVICFCNGETVRAIFEAIRRLNLTDRFTFIISDSWQDFDFAVEGTEEQAWGSIFVRNHVRSIPVFSKYWTSLKPRKNERNLLFSKFWEQKFNCTLPMLSDNVTSINSNGIDEKSLPKFCTGNESLADTYIENPNHVFVMKAVWAMAYGFHNMMTEICGVNYTGVCRNMFPVNTGKLVKKLMELSFEYMDNRVSIDKGNSECRYDIMNFQKLSNDTFALVQIGYWSKGKSNIHESIQNRQNKNVTSICSLPCPLGHRQRFDHQNQNYGCCWECELCGDHEYVSSTNDACIECARGERPNPNRTGCDKIPVSEHEWGDCLSIMIMAFSVVGIISTVFTFYVFVKYRNTPIVKASNREICYIILVGMLLGHITIYIVVAERSRFVCAASRVIPFIACTTMFAGLFMKTYRMSRVLGYKQKSFPKKKMRLMSTSAQVAIISLCIAIQLVICFIMLVIVPPEPRVIYVTRDHFLHACLSAPMAVIPPAIPIIIFHSLCIIYGIKTRNIPRKFNESKFIGFAMLFTFIIGIIMLSMYHGARFRSQILGGGLSLNALAILIFLFLPKVYIIILRPEKNKRALFITNKLIRTHIGPGVNSNVSELGIDNPVEISHDDISTIKIAENNCRLRNVAIQTSSQLLQNIRSSSDGDDDDSTSEEDTNEHYRRQICPEDDGKSLANAGKCHRRLMRLHSSIF